MLDTNRCHPDPPSARNGPSTQPAAPRRTGTASRRAAAVMGVLALSWATPAPVRASPAPAADLLDPATIYQKHCALCHGADRGGYAADHAPSLRSAELMGGATGSYLWTAIAFGRPGTAMSAFSSDQGGPLSPAEQRVLLNWLVEGSGAARSPVPDTPVTGNPKLGARVYAKHCATCHGDEGQGATGTALVNPVFLATASDAFVRHTIVNGRHGTPMPSFRDELRPEKIDAVVAFLRSRAAGWEAPLPVRVHPPDPSAAVLHPAAPVARLAHREGRFVSAASVVGALARKERIVLLDARPLSDWQRSHIPGALPVPFYDGVESIVEYLPRDGTPIVAYCACPHAASGKVVDALSSLGFAEARILDEGILHWMTRGYPIDQGAVQ